MVSKYAGLGVDAGKGTVRAAFAKAIDNDFPGAFVNIVRDPERPGEVFTSHMDGDGSKFIQRVLYCRKGGDPNPDPRFFSPAADDALSMNTSDIAAAGFVSGVITITDILNVSRFHVPKREIMNGIAERLASLRDLYREHGFKIYFLGGETADLPDQVGTATFDVNVHARAREEDLILGNVQPGDRIWGFASDGQATWEESENSGIMSNGHTLAATCILSSSYEHEYPDLRLKNQYRGRYKLSDPCERTGMTIAAALTSPTRQWPILIKMIIDKAKERGLFDRLHGITINTGGGATKCIHLGTGGIIYNKYIPKPPGIFTLIQAESGEAWCDMFQDFNCGIGIDVIGDKALEPVLKEISLATRVRLHDLGICEENDSEGNRVVIETPFGQFTYP